MIKNKLSKQLNEGRIYSRLPQFRRKLEQARLDIFYALSLGKGYVSLSWGKQSTVLAHMIYGLSADTACVFWKNPTSSDLNNFDQVRDTFMARWPVRYVEFQEGDTDLPGNGRAYMKNNGLSVVFMGLVSDESLARKYSLGKASVHNCFRYASGYLRCCPLRKWKIMDIAAYVSLYDLPLLETYHRYGLEARTSAGLTPGSHAEQGIDLLSRENQQKIKDYYNAL